MMRALFAAISGLRNHQLFMDTVGNNLANVNTSGYKASRVTFSDLLSQTISSGSAPNTNLGGINSKQIGLGAQIASIDVLQLQGSMQSTGKATDLAIQGDGFFILSNGLKQSYSRDGAFDIASDGSLVNPSTGMKVQGWTAINADGSVNTTGAISEVKILIGQSTVASPTGNTAAPLVAGVQPNPGATFAGNLDARAAVNDAGSVGMTAVDSQGRAHNVTLTFTNTSPNNWSVSAYSADTTLTGISTDPANPTALGNLAFGANGQLTTSPPQITMPIGPTTDTGATFGNTAFPNQIMLDFAKLTGLAATSEVAMSAQDGFTAGTLVAFRLGAKGEIVGVYTNGLTQNLGQLALANFVNPGGLTRAGGNLFDESASSGAVIIGKPGESGRGIASSGNLESSNVDLAREFTNMIIGQRGFQANARVITTSDEMLNDLVHLRQ